MANKLFELFGTITIRNSDANKAIDETTQKAQDSETKMSGAFKKIGEAVNQGFKKQPIDNTNNALKGMTETIDKQESDLQKLKDKYVDLYLTHGKNSKEAKACAGEIAGLSNELNYNKNNLDKAKSAADKLDKSLGDTSNTADSSGSKIKAAFKKIGSAAAKVAKVGAIAITAVATGIGAMTSKAVSYYSDYEQLVGGVETLFKESSEKVVEYANKAYQTAGLSANDYMETVTGFSASLLQSLDGDTAKATESANMAITDMSDNANKMGTSMEMIQNAYQGFAKQNYTMLDNLKLGYGGTKEEMERLLSDAQAISGIEYDISSFADIVDAIHVVQTEMGITGTTAKEASTTIQGSIGSMKAAFENFLTGMADPSQDFDALLGNLVDSVVTVADNLIPRIAATLPRLVNGLISLIQALVPQIPGILSQLLPAIITGATDLINGIVAVLPQLISILLQSLPALIDGVVQIFNGIIEALPQVVQMLCDALPELIPLLISAAAQMILGLCQALPEIIQAIIDALPSVLTSIVSSLIENLPLLIQGAVQLIIGLVKAFPQIFIVMFKSIPTIVKQLVDSFKKAFPDVAEWFGNKFHGAVERIKKVFSAVGDFFKGIWSNIKDAFGSVGTWFHDTFSKAWQKVKDVFSKGGEVFSGIKEGIDKTFKKVVNAIIKGINTIISKPFETINNVFSRLKDIKIAGWHPFSWLKEFGVPKIPELELATGTIVDKATPAIIGEDGAEAVVPLEKHTEWIDRVADKVVSKMGATRSDSVLAAKIDELISFVKSLKIYLNTGALVGGISDEMNEALGNIAFAAERGR